MRPELAKFVNLLIPASFSPDPDMGYDAPTVNEDGDGEAEKDGSLFNEYTPEELVLYRQHVMDIFNTHDDDSDDDDGKNFSDEWIRDLGMGRNASFQLHHIYNDTKESSDGGGEDTNTDYNPGPFFELPGLRSFEGVNASGGDDIGWWFQKLPLYKAVK
ncbi:unnamed protein product [Clonostachys rosea]|uniref:Uncharacterized protein n=1 Tax=Bionectria ochroleuca TaxID=29856 RepID=A0ABY6UZJ2_BIOOC|nr:unnamed protein product [Clonostachys rosea]